MASFSKGLTVHEVTELLEQGDIDDILNDVNDIFMEPPANVNNYVTDEDSDDEGLLGDINHMPASLLNAHIVIHTPDTEDAEVANKVSANKTQKKPKIRLGQKTKKIQDTQQTVLWRQRDLETPNIFVDDQKPNVYYNTLQPYELFELFFDQQVLEMIVDYSNTYASNKNQTLQIDINELKCFLGILLLSGYNEVSRRRMYWEKSPDTHNNLVSDAMRRNRFEQIFSNIHFCNNSKLDEHDKFSKIRPLISMLNSRFLIHAPHQQFHSIDESMVPYFGRHGCKQFIRGKPIRFGFKIWVGTLRLGYVVWISPYQGKSGDLQNTEYGLGASVIISYANNLLTHRIAPYHLVFDNFFTGLPLLEKLSEMGLYGTGTIRSNRTKKCPINLVAMKKIKRDSYESYVSDSGILVCVWKDNSTVTIASNNVGVEPIIAAKRWSVSDKRTPTPGRRGGKPSNYIPRYDGAMHYLVPQEKQTRCAECHQKTTPRCIKCDVGVHLKCDRCKIKNQFFRVTPYGVPVRLCMYSGPLRRSRQLSLITLSPRRVVIPY
ncbi:hypothetical protein QTP88_000847 [Uroleucon formosanum]